MAHAGGSQLSLNIRLRDDATFDNYLVHQGVAAVCASLDDSGERFLFLHGPFNAGKSHLLQAACHACEGVSLYLPLATIADMAPSELLDDIQHLALICLDDLQAVAGQRDWEYALFKLYNAVQASEARLVIAADAPPNRLATVMPDLRSRLTAMLVCSMPPPDDTAREAILIARAHNRGLSMPSEVARYVSHRAGRSLGDVMAVLEVLDRASLTYQRGLSIPFVRQVMGWHSGQAR